MVTGPKREMLVSRGSFVRSLFLKGPGGTLPDTARVRHQSGTKIARAMILDRESETERPHASAGLDEMHRSAKAFDDMVWTTPARAVAFMTGLPALFGANAAASMRAGINVSERLIAAAIKGGIDPTVPFSYFQGRMREGR